MLQIHFIDDAGQPLCSVPESDRWLWTVNRHAVTCAGCVAALSAADARRPAAEADPAAVSGHDAKTASRAG